MLWNEIRTLFYKELLLEGRERIALQGLLLYLISTIMVVYMGFQLKAAQLTPATWNTLYWIVVLFSAINAISKSFMQEPAERQLYYYTLSSPQGIILSKMLYNILLMWVVALLALVIFSVMLNNPVADMPLFVALALLGSLSFATTLTLVSGIASKAGNNSTLMAVLSFPIIIPLLLMVVGACKNAVDGLDRSTVYDELLIIGALNLLVVTLSLVLFPYIWRN